MRSIVPSYLAEVGGSRDRAEIFHRQHSVVVGATSYIESFDHERRRHAVWHFDKGRGGNLKTGGSAEFQTKPLDDGQCLEAGRASGFQDMSERLFDCWHHAPSAVRHMGALIWIPDKRGVCAWAYNRARFCSNVSSISLLPGPS